MKEIFKKVTCRVCTKKALKKVRPSVTKEVAETYETIRDQFSAAYAKEMKRESPNYFG